MLARPSVAVAATELSLGQTGGALDIVHLRPLVERTVGDPRVTVALLDGPVAAHPHLAGARMRQVGGTSTCMVADSRACAHGTFVAGILAASRESQAPGICPGCTFLVRPIFAEAGFPSTSPAEVGLALLEAIEAGARVVNLSAEATGSADPMLDDALSFAGRLGVLVVAAAGNGAILGRTAIASHPSVLPVVGADARGRPLPDANLGGSIGRRGLAAPGLLTSLDATGTVRRGGGSSAATAVVTGAVALLWSLFPDATATEVTNALSGRARRRAVTPPLMDAEAAYRALEVLDRRRCR